MATPNDLLRTEAGEIGYSRYSDPEQGTKYGRWYADLVKQPWFGTNGVAFCAMGQSWSFAQAGMDAKSIGLPAAGCGTIREAAIRNGHEVKNRRDAQPGDLVLFRWDGKVDARDYSDHVGMVEKNMGSAGIQTIEFNTGNGQVLRRSRAWGVVQMIVRPPYSGASGGSTPSGGSASKPASSASFLNLGDTRWTGPLMTKELQRQLGCSVVDGIVSGQTHYNKEKILWAWTAVQQGTTGSACAVKLQRFLTAKGFKCAADGHLGPNSVKALQGYLNAKLGLKLAVDGYYGNATSKALGAALQKGLFK